MKGKTGRKVVEEALLKMKRGKAPGPLGVTTDLLRYAGETGVRELIETEERTPTEWGTSYTIPVYKGKGDTLLCGKYRRVRLLEHGPPVSGPLTDGGGEGGGRGSEGQEKEE